MIDVKMELHELAFLIGFLTITVNQVNPLDRDYMKGYIVRLVNQYNKIKKELKNNEMPHM